jgi:CheY-like chemotaxis protein
MNTEFHILSARILVVDDHVVNVQLLEQFLAATGYTDVNSTMNPQEVEGLHATHPYDLILLDLNMPAMDGFQVMEALRKGHVDPYLPVIVLTAEPAHKLRALQAGAKDFISKPFDLVEVKTRIYNMLEVRLLYKKLDNYSKLLEMAVQQAATDPQPAVSAKPAPAGVNTLTRQAPAHRQTTPVQAR